MTKTKLFALLAGAVALAFGANAYAAKEIKVSGNNTSYSADDVQKLAATAVSMGVKEPVNLEIRAVSVGWLGQVTCLNYCSLMLEKMKLP